MTITSVVVWLVQFTMAFCVEEWNEVVLVYSGWEGQNYILDFLAPEKNVSIIMQKTETNRK